MVAALGEQITMVHHARDRGWDSLFTGQHYLNEGDNQQFQIVPASGCNTVFLTEQNVKCIIFSNGGLFPIDLDIALSVEDVVDLFHVVVLLIAH